MQFLVNLLRNFSKNEGVSPDWCMMVADWCENIFSVFVIFGYRVVLPAQTWLHSRKNTLWVLHQDAFGQCVMLRNMMDGIQTKSKFEERVAERVGANDGWTGQLLQHRTGKTSHSLKNVKKRKQLAQKHTKRSRGRRVECAVTTM